MAMSLVVPLADSVARCVVPLLVRRTVPASPSTPNREPADADQGPSASALPQPPETVRENVSDTVIGGDAPLGRARPTPRTPTANTARTTSAPRLRGGG